jgi:hypothetical protein
MAQANRPSVGRARNFGVNLQVVGAGVGRTGTLSLKRALERLLDGPCYHMVEVLQHPQHVPQWLRAAQGEPMDWDAIFGGYVATVDWPAASSWPELTAANPDALVVLSVRADSETWWRSASGTIFELTRNVPAGALNGWDEMWATLAHNRFTDQIENRSEAIDAYERHNSAVRAGVAAARLLEWRPGDGWAPLCARLDLPEPDEPFPHLNPSEDIQANFEPILAVWGDSPQGQGRSLPPSN